MDNLHNSGAWVLDLQIKLEVSKECIFGFHDVGSVIYITILEDEDYI